MEQIYRRSVLSAAVCCLYVAAAMGVPARREPVELMQPDGTSVTLRLCGDESFHFFLTDDGYAADRDDEGYFRLIGNDGRLTSIAVTTEATGAAGAIDRAKAIEARREASLATSPFTAWRKAQTASVPSRHAGASGGKWDNADGHDLRTFPSVGEQKVLVILVSFADIDWTFSDNPQADMTAMLNEPGFSRFGCTGSARDYFLESSNGIFDPRFDVYGPVKLSQNCAYYGERVGYSNDANPQKMVLEACRMLDDTVDFSQYDRDGDGLIDNVYVFYAGYGENEGAESWRIWPHAWDVRNSSDDPLYVDGVQVGRYACSNEIIYGRDIMTGIGTMCHEFSHVLGLPDLYATNYSGALTPGKYTIMDQGPYNNSGRTPPLYSAYERYALEWQKPVDVKGDARLTMLPLSARGNAYRYTIDPQRPTEYFLFENRQQEGFDAFLPSHGMLVWHVNFDASLWRSNSVNDDPSDMHLDLIEADGLGGDATAGGDTFPGETGVFQFLASSEPRFANRNGQASPIDVTEIRETSDGAVTFAFGNGLSDDPAFSVASPEMFVSGIGADHFTLSLRETSEHAVRVSVAEEIFDEDEETFGVSRMPELSFAALPEEGGLTVDGLEAGRVYTVRVYGMTDVNASMPQTIAISMPDEGSIAGTPGLRHEAEDRLSWGSVEGADGYRLTVGEFEYLPEGETVTAGFDSRHLPKGWNYMGSMSNAEGTFGQSAPSLFLCEADDYLYSDTFDSDVTAVALWARSASETTVFLHLYSWSGNGWLFPLGSRAVSRDGGEMVFDGIPEGVRRVILTVSAGGDNGVYVDDIGITLTSGPKYTPVAGHDGLAVPDTAFTVEGLKPEKEYVAFVKAVKGGQEGERSPMLRFRSNGTGGVSLRMEDSAGFRIEGNDLIPASDTLKYDLFALDGRRIVVSHTGILRLPGRGVYLVRVGGETFKLIR